MQANNKDILLSKIGRFFNAALKVVVIIMFIFPFFWMVSTVQDMSKAEIRINRNPVEDFNDFNEEFMELMKSKIEEMFDENIPFKQTTNEDNCKYCKYKDFCRK